METSDHHDAAFRQPAAKPVGAHIEDARFAVGGFGDDAHLRAGHGDGRHAQLMQGHRQQGDRHLLASGQQHVHFPLGRIAADGVGLGREFIGGVTHGRHHDHQLMPFVLAGGNALRHGLDALHAADGGAAELLHQQGHPRRLV